MRFNEPENQYEFKFLDNAPLMSLPVLTAAGESGRDASSYVTNMLCGVQHQTVAADGRRDQSMSRTNLSLGATEEKM